MRATTAAGLVSPKSMKGPEWGEPQENLSPQLLFSALQLLAVL